MDNYIISDKCKENNIKKKNLINDNLGNVEIKFIDKNYLDSFKEYIKNEVDKFTPNNSKSEIHLLIKALWHQYLFNNVDDSQYYDYIKILNSNIKHTN